MKLHLNLTLRRAVLAAMAMVTLGTAQAAITTTTSGQNTHIKGDGTLAPGAWNSIAGSATLSIIDSEDGGVLLQGGASYTTGGSLFIGGSGYGSSTGTATDGSLDVASAILTTGPLYVGTSTVSPITGLMYVNGGTVNAGSELTVGAYMGNGEVEASNKSTIAVKNNAGSAIFRMGYHTGAGYKGTNEFTINDSTLTVGAAGGALDMTSIGQLGGESTLYLSNGANATLHDQVIVGESGIGCIYVNADSTLNMTGATILGYSKGAEGNIISLGTVKADNLIVGNYGTGSVELSGGSLTAKEIVLGYEAGSKGTLEIMKGATLSPLGKLYVGYKGTGELSAASNISATDVYVTGTASKATMTGATLSATNLTATGGTVATAAAGILDISNLVLAEGGVLDIRTDSSAEVDNLLAYAGTTIKVGYPEGSSTLDIVKTANLAGNVSIQKGAHLYTGTETTNSGSITNDGYMEVHGSMTSVGTIGGSGSLTVTKGASLTLGGTTRQSGIENNGSITVIGSGLVTTGSLTGSGTTTLTVDKTTASGSTIISGLTGEAENTMKAEIDMSNTTALVGKDVTFVNEGNVAVSLKNAQTGAGTDNWAQKYIDVDGSTTKLWFTSASTDASAVQQIKFTKLAELVADVTTTDTNKEVTYIDPTTQEETTASIELEYEKQTLATETKTLAETPENESLASAIGATSTTSEAPKLQTVVVESPSANTAQTPGIGLVVGSGVESSELKVQTVVVNQVKRDDKGQMLETAPLSTTGMVLVLEGNSTHAGQKDSKETSHLGFAEGLNNQTITATNAEGNKETKKTQTLDLIQVSGGSNVSVSNLNMHSTHALTVEKGATITFDGVTMNVGGSTDHNIKTKDVVVEVLDKDGKPLKDAEGNVITKTVQVENKNIAHLETGTLIGEAEADAEKATATTVNIKNGSVVQFEKVYSDDANFELGTTTIAGANTLVQMDDATLGMDAVVLDKDGNHDKTADGHDRHGQQIVFDHGAHLKGTGTIKNIHMKQGTTFTVGSSPGKFSASELTVDGVTNFYIITNSKDWENYTGDESQLSADKYNAADGSFGAISQLVVEGPVTLNGDVAFIYQEHVGNGVFRNCADQEAARKEMGQYFTSESSIKFVDIADNGTLTLGSDFDVLLETLPELEDGLFWDVSSLFTEHTVYVINEILEEPCRVANSLVSAGETVLNFGRLTESQAALRKAGTTRTWGSAIADFSSVDGENGRIGYDYNTWGGAVGVDHAFTSRTVVGVAFGCTWGENEAEKDNGYYSAGSIDQDGKMLGLYGTHKFRTKDLMNDVKLSAFAAYGWFENDSSRTGLKSGHNATAEWDSDAWVLSASLSRDITTDNGLVVTPYVGVEYTKASMDDFTEKGRTYDARYTADTDYSNLAVKVGVNVSTTIGSFTPYAGIAYINDVARDTPEVTATGKRTITGKAAMPGRSALQLKLGTGVKLSDSWDAYAGYTAELRDQATEHNVNVGVGYTF